jgi:SpoVK/Ycf46/Vps4 family AAA+-type ATPase
MSNEMFQLLENYDGIIIFATNLVADFDKAFKSRILAFIEFKQPDYEARKKLIKTMIPSKLPLHPEFTDDSIGILAEISDGFCGREIRKAMLTTLAEGAMKGVEVFTIDEFRAGFSSVKEETLAVDKSAGGEIGGNLIFDFINECSIGSAIMDVCQYVAWQRGELTSGQKAELLRIARYLNVEAPDLTISYANKDLNDSIAKIQENHREAESLRYVCEVLANSETDADEFKAELAHLAERLNVVDNGVYLEYFNTLKSLFANLS